MAHATHVLPPIPEPSARVTRAPARERWSWAIYDFANTIWSMNVASLYFATWLVVDLGASNTTYSWAAAISSLLMAVSIPLLGAISDARRRRKPWVVGFTVLSCVATAALGIVGYTMAPLFGESVIGAAVRPEGFRVAGATLFVIALAFTVANYAYQAAQPFYNAMMTDLVPPAEYGRLSGLGTAVGYVGTIVGLLLVAPFFEGALPVFGALPDALAEGMRRAVPFTSSAGRVSTFVPTALLFLLFTLPLVLFCRDRNPAPAGTPIAWRAAFTEIARTVKDAKQYPGVLRFIVASFIYQDAFGTIVGVMGLYAIKAVGFDQGSVNTLFVVLTVPAVLGSWLCGRLVDRYGAKRTLTGVLGFWVALLVAMIMAPSQAAFWIVGGAIGFIFGGIATAERPLLLSLIPDHEAGRFFSLMLLSSRAAAFMGPLVWGYTVDGFEPGMGTGFAYRAGVTAVALFFAVSLFVLRGVPDRRLSAAAATA